MGGEGAHVQVPARRELDLAEASARLRRQGREGSGGVGGEAPEREVRQGGKGIEEAAEATSHHTESRYSSLTECLCMQ